MRIAGQPVSRASMSYLLRCMAKDIKSDRVFCVACVVGMIGFIVVYGCLG